MNTFGIICVIVLVISIILAITFVVCYIRFSEEEFEQMTKNCTGCRYFKFYDDGTPYCNVGRENKCKRKNKSK